MYQETYHLYHHQPDPLDEAAITDQAWLLGNGMSYSVVATIKAPNVQKAHEGLLAHRDGQHLRPVEISSGNILRPTLPGDVLVGKKNAWMVLVDGQLRELPYGRSQALRAYTHEASVTSLSWSPDSLHVVAAGKEVLLHSLSREKEQSYTATSYCRHTTYAVGVVAWSPDGHLIASGSHEEVHVWKPCPGGGPRKAALGSLLICRTQERDSHYDHNITALCWSLGSKTLWAGREDGTIIRWDATTGECLQQDRPHHRGVTALAYAPDGLRLASSSKDGTLRIWDVSMWEQEAVTCQHTDWVASFAWPLDGSMLVSCCRGEQSLHLWDADTGAALERLPLSVSFTSQFTIQSVAWSPDGSLIVAGCDDGTLQVFEVASRRHIQTYRACANVHVVAWSPDGTLIGSGEGTSNGVHIWQVNGLVKAVSQKEGH